MSGNMRWSKEEEEYLVEMWGGTSIAAIAARLGRSITAVKIKANRIGLTSFIHSGERITFAQLEKALGLENSTWRRLRWERLGLKVVYKKAVEKRRYAMVKIEDFWDFAEKNKDLIDFSKMEPLILGKEPEWAAAARRADSEGTKKRDRWTAAEDSRLRMLTKKGYTYSQIAEELNRTSGAVKRRVIDLGFKQRPVKAKIKKWSEEETKLMLKLREEGQSCDLIGQRFGRSGVAVKGKLERLKKPWLNTREYRRARAREKNEQI